MPKIALGEDLRGLSYTEEYDTSTVRNIIKAHHAEPVILLKGICLLSDSDLTAEDFYNIETYHKRHVIERLLGRLKENRRLAYVCTLIRLTISFASLNAITFSELFT